MHLTELEAFRKFRQEHRSPWSRQTLVIPVEQIRTLEQQQFPPARSPSRLQDLTDSELYEQAAEVPKWIFEVLDYHDRAFGRPHDMRMFRSAVEKEMAGHRERWSEKEHLYMTLTTPALPSPAERMKSASILVLHSNLAVRLEDVSSLTPERMERILCAKDSDPDLHKTCKGIFEKFCSIQVDHFACAVPLSSLQPPATASVVDENAGACPICQHSYTDLSNFEIQDLVADYPVRIKYCGHIVGKACLEQWMQTPKIDPAKYPHRTCPLCRVELEGVRPPPAPNMVKKKLRIDRRAMDTVRELNNSYNMEYVDCYSVVAACISMSIACKELLAEVHGQKRDGVHAGFDEHEKILNEKLREVDREMAAWGFRENAAWKHICNSWMDSGVVRKE